MYFLLLRQQGLLGTLSCTCILTFVMGIEKLVRNIADLETCFHTVIFLVTTFLRIQKYTAIINTKYLIDENFVIHDFRRL